MIPVRDSGAPLGRRPALTLGILGLNVLVFVLMGAGRGHRFEYLTLRWALIPGNLTGAEPVDVVTARLVSSVGAVHEEVLPLPKDLAGPERRDRLVESLEERIRLRRLPPLGWRLVETTVTEQAVPAVLTLLASMFMHGGWGHLLGNMIFLWVFGARLEDRLGPARYLGFYLVCGVLASLSHVVFNLGSTVPVVGASGAISALLGGYVLLWPRGRILTLVPIWPFFQLIELPAKVFVAIWVGMQLLIFYTGGGGVAVWAHLGGFVFGLLLVPAIARLARDGSRPSPPERVRRWDPDHFR